ncbi:MAG: hypothetical protein PHH41_11070 [Sulfurimonas sp.]|nr:hypothetical protein [Sulfurimonas sp.]
MKNLLVLIVLSVFLSAEPMSNEDFLKKIQESQERQKQSLVEIEKAKQFHKTLEQLAKKLEEEKLERKKQEEKEK